MLKQSKNIYFLGIKGVAMANLAVILKKMGKNVTGCDVEEEFITDKLLKDNKINWATGFNFNKLPKQTNLIVYSAAHGGTNNPLIVEALKKKINIISQAMLLGELIDQFETKIAVCGCHGKTTTSSLLVYTLNKLNQKPSYLVGVPFFTGYQTAPGSAVYQGGDFQGKKYFVAEADEYGVNPPIDKTPKFNLLDPDYIIATNIDFDHPDVYKDIEETKKAFIKFFGNKKIIANIDDGNLLRCIDTLKSITYGESDKADYQIINCNVTEDESTFEIKNVGKFKILLFGKHNISNASAVIVQLLELGFKADEIKKALVGFTGAKRRFEKIYQKNNIYLFDDYGHHPTEIAATINAAKNRFPKKRVIIIFQPHTYSRTQSLLKEFGESLALADISFILPVFASARENPKNFNVRSQNIVDMINIIKDSLSLRSVLNKVRPYFGSKEQVVDKLKSILKVGDIVFTMGAGDVYKLKDAIIKIINIKFQMTNKVQKSKVKSQKLNLKVKSLKIEENKDLTFLNTLRINTIAEYFLEAKNQEDLIEGKKFALKNKLPLFILAGGSNLALVKEKINGLIIKNNYKELKILEETKKDVLISVSSGYPVSLLVNETVSKGYQGFEYHKGLPGTVGGAVYMNSKWTRPVSYFGNNLEYAYLINDQGETKKVDKNYFQFAYDYSNLQKTKEILVKAIFKLKKVDPLILKERAKLAFEYRKKTQPTGVKTSGCFFRNIEGRSAGQMIDQAGLKNFSVGDFFVSPTHANFIINKGHGKSKDLLKLISIIKEKVRQKFGVKLSEEVIVI